MSVVSVNDNNQGEIRSFKPFNSPVEKFNINHGVGKVAVASMGQIKFFNLNTWQEENNDRIDFTKSSGSITEMHWTKDGTIMSISTNGGYFLGFLTVVP